MAIIAVECHYGQYCHYGHDHFRYKHDVVRLQWVSVGFTAWVMIDTPDFCFVFLHCYMAVLLHFAAQPWWNIFPSTQDTVYRTREHRMQDTGAGYNNCFYRASQKKINQGEMYFIRTVDIMLCLHQYILCIPEGHIDAVYCTNNASRRFQ